MSDASNIFISYSHKDKEWVREFVHGLQERGLSPWLDEAELEPGARLTDAIESAFRGSNTIVFVISPNSLSSKWMEVELGAALGTGKRIVPIISSDVLTGSLPYSLRIRNWIERRSPHETAEAFALAFDGDSAVLSS